MNKLCVFVLFFLLPTISLAQAIGWVSDQQLVPLRSGQGSNFRIVHRGLPSGTRLVINQTNEESGYSQVTTSGGTQGWIRSQYLMRTLPSAQALEQEQQRAAKLEQQLTAIQDQLMQVRPDNQQTASELDTDGSRLDNTSAELAEVLRISSNAITLDTDNRRLVEESEVLKSRIEVLEADNQRLQDSSDNDAFLNGAFAVVLGVFITLLVPRLWPRRRASSSWA